MKYYKNTNDKVYAYESDGSQDPFIPADQTFISEEEADLLRFPPFTAEQMVEIAHARITDAYQAAIVDLTAGYPPEEVASWPKQEAEARAWLLDPETLTPWINGASIARSINVPNLVALIIRNADNLAPAYGALTGKRQNLRDAIDALVNPTQAQLDAIQW
jgi:hypothetical protein